MYLIIQIILRVFKGVKKLLSKDGFFILKALIGLVRFYQENLINYHEHVTYVNVRSVNKLAERTGLNIYDNIY